MKKKYLFLLYGVLAVLLSYSVALVACDNFDPGTSPSNSFEGTWSGRDENGDRVRLVITGNTWEITFLEGLYSYPGSHDSWDHKGIYTVNDRNVISFFNGTSSYTEIGEGVFSGNRLTTNFTRGPISGGIHGFIEFTR